jgi:tetrahedral aminopeptidase
MLESSLQLLKDLLLTPSPSGYEEAIQKVVREWAKSITDDVRTDLHGNVILTLPATIDPDSAPKVLLAGHCDQIGLMVQHIDNEGYLYVQPIGGWDTQVLIGQALDVWTASGPVPGVMARKAAHLLTPEERNKVPNLSDLWVDIGAKNKEDAESVVRHGDPVTLRLGFTPMRNGLATAVAMDDKVGLWTALEALRLVAQVPERHFTVVAVSTVQEEIGLRGATTSTFGVDPVVGIAIDVCHASDTPGNDKKTLGDVKLGGGPVLFRGPNINPRVLEHLEIAAKKLELAVQVRGMPKASGTDANTIQISRGGVATGLVGIPNRYMHSPVEVVHLEDLEHAARILAEFCGSISRQTSWIP